MRASRWLPAALIATAVVGIASLLVVLRATQSNDAVGPTSNPTVPTSLTPPPPDVVRDTQSEPAVNVDAQTFLASYWGSDWPRIEIELRKMEGWADYDLSKLPLPGPREGAVPELRRYLENTARPDVRITVLRTYLEIGPGSGELQDRQWIQSKYSPKRVLNDADYAAIDAHVGPAQRVLEDSANRIVDAIQDAKTRLFDQGEFLIGPYSTSGLTNSRENKPGLLFSSAFGTVTGWAASIMVLESDVPGFAEMRAENIALILERNRALEEIIGTF